MRIFDPKYDSSKGRHLYFGVNLPSFPVRQNKRNEIQQYNIKCVCHFIYGFGVGLISKDVCVGEVGGFPTCVGCAAHDGTVLNVHMAK